jgi:hypothetical protein
MWITSRTPYLEQAERIAALTTRDDIWLLVSARGPARGPARTVVAIWDAEDWPALPLLEPDPTG